MVRLVSPPPTRFALTLLALACAGAGRTPDDPLGDQPPPGEPLPPPPLVPLPPAGKAPASVVLGALDGELGRAWKELGKQKTRPYFLSYAAYDEDEVAMTGENGVLAASTAQRARRLLIDVRIGDPAFDSTHPAKTERWEYRRQDSVEAPIDDDPVALRAVAWEATQDSYRRAAQRYRRLLDMRAKGDLTPAVPDFSPAPVVVHLEPPVALEADVAGWESRVRALSARFREAKVSGHVSFGAEAINRWLVNSEGTRVQTGATRFRVFIHTGKTSVPFTAATAAGLPSLAQLQAAVDQAIADDRALSEAPRAEAWSGPALFEGPAAAVFVHELLGHRLEAQRLRDDRPSQVLAGLMGQPIMPAFLSVYDDPTAGSLGTRWLPGYRIDDEGVAARRVDLVKDGLLAGVLLSRMPAPGFSGSNGHAVRDTGRHPPPLAARQTNLVVQPARAVTFADLRERLRAEARRQGKDHGLLVRELRGHFRGPMEDSFRKEPARFGVRPLRLYRVFADGRPDELVRDASIKDPSAADLKWILAAANDYQAINFRCLGDSGSVATAAISPSLLFQRIDITPATRGD